MKLKGKKALVVGLGKTGEAVCDFLLDAGASLMISEKRGIEELGPVFEKWNNKVDYLETGGHTEDLFLQPDLIISSPGIPPLPLFQTARKHGIQVLSEIELAFRFLKGKIIGITGSNGKSTTTSLIHKILKEGGLHAHLAGNIGTPLIQFVADSQDKDIYVTELSSFQ
ncbi:MAG: UDP-N-acetylmuramoyl-L-alanine--D-glutamate ligase, partial [Candidatus Aminicenantes bacterium]|nr:UDP-N-acetylmuramoyl-L-alanine--D-glutamate ligase [Candidatus Aminicenantes bacterium]